MKRKNNILAGAIFMMMLVLAACEKTPEEEVIPLPELPTIRALSESVALYSGGEAYADFLISPFETKFNYDVRSDACAISIVNGLGQNVTEFVISKIEPLSNDPSDKGKYRIFLRDDMKKTAYEMLCKVSFKDSYGRSTTTGGFMVRCQYDKETQKYLDTGLKLLIIDTEGGEEPTCEYVSHPEGCNGAGIRNATKVPGSMVMLKGSNILYSTGPYKKDESGLTIKIRGNTSAYGAKKPYKIKLQKKKDLLFRNEEKLYKDKEWLLLRYDDLRIVAGSTVNKLRGIQWTPAYEYVNLILNGDYKGLYILCESVKRNEDCRLNVSETGYILEYDAYWWNEDVHFTGGWNYSMEYTFKYPDSEEVTAAQIKYIRDYITKVEASVRNGTYDQYIDVMSFARWLLAHDVLGILDCAGSNYYLTKYDNTSSSKLMMANLWDFDSIYNMKDNWSNTHMWGANYFPTLLQSFNHTFKDTYIALWESHADICKTASNYMKGFISTEEGKGVNASIPYESKRWHSTHPTVETAVNTSMEWFKSRGSWLNSAISGLK